jgi:DNA-binding transcriptional LysR family regulator
MQTRFKLTLRIAPPNCMVMFTKREKFCATIFKERRKSASLDGQFIRGKPYPLSGQGFYGSPITRRKLRGVPRDGHAIAAQHPARQPAKYLASCPRNFPAMAGQWQWQCRRMAGRMTRKTTCLAPDMDARCPRRKLARRLGSNLNHDI